MNIQGNDFSKVRRLLTKKEYEQVFNCAKKIAKDEFLLLYCFNNQACARLGLVISKKKIRYACHRNRMKRLIRESFRRTKLPAMDMILLVRKPVELFNNKQILLTLDYLWQQLDISYVE